MKNKMGIIADDLTGANDSGVQLAIKKLSTSVVFDYTNSSKEMASDVLIVDTDSRARAKEDAYKAVVEAATFLKRNGYKHIYKKVDSTLRGNLEAELAALESVYNPDMVVIAPAYPKMRRQTINGHHFVDGKIITETEFSNDPKTPVQESFLPKLLNSKNNRKITLLNKEVWHKSKEEINNLIQSALVEGNKWFVCDAAAEEDLINIAKLFSEQNKSIIWAGSAGLIEYLPEMLHLIPSSVNEQEDMEIQTTLIVSGSLSHVTKKQLFKVDRLQDSYFMQVDPVDLINGSYRLDEFMEIVQQNKEQHHFVLYVEADDDNRKRAIEAGKMLGLSKHDVSAAISNGLGTISTHIVKNVPFIKGLVLTGGDTAKAVCRELGVTEMDLYMEIEPGLPFGKIRTETNSYWAVTKAGGFGQEDSLIKALEFLINNRRVIV
ncbi:Hrp-dependent type III effector protein [Niallia circulans]|uniref:four-carbon acid sugar kinase family protein n=1 Tax=Niallia circulans TaxID=1397 RepID=UPI00201DB44A|nr:four-carbon acid sugar kinase family protein [Niallia circulans]UQZ73821.1 Hrp-dependent type III effector protein [Niallia circulans]